MQRFRTVECDGPTRSTRRRWVSAAVWLPAAVVLGGALVAGPQETESADETIRLTRDAIDRYHKVRELIGRETAQLAEDKVFLADEIELVTAQIEETRRQIAESETTIAETAKRVEKLETEEKDLEAATASLVEVIPGLEERTKELVKRVPAPAFDITSLARQRLPENPAESDEKLSVRFSAVAGVLTLLDRFNTEVHSTPEIRTLQNGQDARVTSLYIGLSHAFYVNGEGTSAGRGVPSPDGYVWSPLDEAAEAVQRCVQIKNGKAAEFVQLPITID